MSRLENKKRKQKVEGVCNIITSQDQKNRIHT